MSNNSPILGEGPELPPIYFVVSGPIAVGKSTFCNTIRDLANVRVYDEPVEGNPYLAPFYDNPLDFSFRLQVYFLNKRFFQHKFILEQKKMVTHWNFAFMQDRSIYEDPIFASVLHQDNLMTSDDYTTYSELFRNMTKNLPFPDTVIYLDVSPDICLQRIAQRCVKNNFFF